MIQPETGGLHMKLTNTLCVGKCGVLRGESIFEFVWLNSAQTLLENGV